jgi:hypothetical protein
MVADVVKGIVFIYSCRRRGRIFIDCQDERAFRVSETIEGTIRSASGKRLPNNCTAGYPVAFKVLLGKGDEIMGEVF